MKTNWKVRIPPHVLVREKMHQCNCLLIFPNVETPRKSFNVKLLVYCTIRPCWCSDRLHIAQILRPDPSILKATTGSYYGDIQKACERVDRRMYSLAGCMV